MYEEESFISAAIAALSPFAFWLVFVYFFA